MEEKHQVDYEGEVAAAVKRYRYITDHELCDRAARLQVQGDYDSAAKCEYALMERLKQMPDEELEELRDYVEEKYEGGVAGYVVVHNVFAMYDMLFT